MIRLGGFSSLLSVLSLMMVFFILLLALTGWQVSTTLVDALSREAEVSVYYDRSLPQERVDGLATALKAVPGVTAVVPVTAEEAYDQMAAILGPEAEALTYFDENPFEAYYAVGVALSQVEPVVQQVKGLPDIAYVRDNLSILKKLDRLSLMIAGIGLLVAAAVGTATFIITAHIIREGVHSHRDQISTLKLLGAPDRFIGTPFVYAGLLLATVSAVGAALCYGAVMQAFSAGGHEILQFLPAMDTNAILLRAVGVLGVFALAMGLAASLFGLRLVRE